MQLDRAKLVKVLAVTSSDKDGEALAAVRLANKMLTAAGVTWEQLLNAPTTTSLFINTAPSPMTDDDWDEMFKRYSNIKRRSGPVFGDSN